MMKTKGPVAERARTQATWLFFVVLGFMAAVSLWTPLAFPRIRQRWFSLPNFFYLWPVPLLTALTAFARLAFVAARVATPFPSSQRSVFFCWDFSAW